MSKYIDKICSRLYAIGAERYNQDIKEIHLVLAIMAQASKDVHDGKADALTRKLANDYFFSDHFLYHCMLAGLEDDDSVRKLFLNRPGKERRNVSRTV